MNSSANKNDDNREVLVDKLQGALNVLRRERDEVNRKKEIAAERLRLLKEERTNAEKSFVALQNEFDQMIAESNADNKNADIEKLEIEVQRLGREVSVFMYMCFEHQQSCCFLIPLHSRIAAPVLTLFQYFRRNFNMRSWLENVKR